MSTSEFDLLIDQLSSEDANTRIAAIKELGNLGRPEAIPELADVYRRDSDKNVRKAAEQALQRFRVMQDKVRPGSGEGSSSGLLRGLRVLLIVTLVLSVLGNIGLFASKLFQPAPTPQTTASDRNSLITLFKQRIDDASANVTQVRKNYSFYQSSSKLPCADSDMAFKPLQIVALADIDTMTYPDMGPLDQQVNDMIGKVNGLTGDYTNLCALKDAKAISDKISSLGGPAKMVQAVDDINNKQVKITRNALQNAIDHPAATITPTFTPSPTATFTPTPTVPTATPTPITPTVPGTTAAPTATPQPGAANVTSAPGASPAANLSYNSLTLKLDTLTNYRYTLKVSYEGHYPNGDSYTGTWQTVLSHNVTPPASQYIISFSDAGLQKGTVSPLKAIAGTAYAPGNSTYTIANSTLYVTGDAAGTKANACKTFAANDKNLASLTSIDPAKLLASPSDIQLTRKMPDEQINDAPAQHYAGQVASSDPNKPTVTVDLYITSDNTQMPLRIMLSKVVPSDIGTPSPTNTLTITVTYNLTSRNQVQNIAVPVSCKP